MPDQITKAAIEALARQEWEIPNIYEVRVYKEMRRSVKVRFDVPGRGWVSVVYFRKYLRDALTQEVQ